MRRAKTTSTRNAGKRSTLRGGQASRGALPRPWMDVALDVTGVDRDIEELLAFVQKTEGCSRDKANAVLVRRLSFAF